MSLQNVTIVDCVASGPIDGTAMRGKNAYCLLNASQSTRTEYQSGYVPILDEYGTVHRLPYNRVMECRIHSTEDNQVHRVQAYIYDARAHHEA